MTMFQRRPPNHVVPTAPAHATPRQLAADAGLPDASHRLIAGGLQSGEEAAANSDAWWRRLNDQPSIMVNNG